MLTSPMSTARGAAALAQQTTERRTAAALAMLLVFGASQAQREREARRARNARPRDEAGKFITTKGA